MFFSVLQETRCPAAKLSTSSSACPLFTSTVAADTCKTQPLHSARRHHCSR